MVRKVVVALMSETAPFRLICRFQCKSHLLSLGFFPSVPRLFLARSKDDVKQASRQVDAGRDEEHGLPLVQRSLLFQES